MKRYILLSEKAWHDELYGKLTELVPAEWKRISTREEFSLRSVAAFDPHIIFIPHWSYIIPAEIFQAYECIVFHMTDLPYGRGGSPLQNLIVNKKKETRISAIRVSQGIDTGDIYLKRPLSLEGTAQEIFMRASDVIGEMIIDIVRNAPVPQSQTGDVVSFKRRTPADGNIYQLQTLEDVYDYIRMLDCEGYPPAFIETAAFRLEFTGASLDNNDSIEAHVRITKK
jgi:methionyl-tRNA formyltransferase